ncbi:zeta toxin family protein [Microbacterium sp. CFBP9034]|uniref:zeta toxin family protein n=1 Tax=Microbacterium sp. CFBP9034 TaxID=3096540 RepID=UPI002A69BB6F|nr:zeta toxin family protein [Microbacterium sp. CFBP9034]MDY0907857.1 zeta toxin family protein [Microbacterium sp. CFBP9034]
MELRPDDAALRTVFERTIAPSVFPEQASDDDPTLTLVVGQPGSGSGRAARGLLAEHPGSAILSADGLRAFHPHYIELSRSRSNEATQIFAEATAAWLRDGLAYARANRRPLLLEGSFQSAQVASATAELFRREGYRAHLAVVGVPRAVSLLSEASRYLLADLAGRATRFSDRAAHDAAFEVTRALVAELEGEASVDRLTVVGRSGEWVFDSHQVDGFEGASRALAREHVTPLTGPEGMRWLSELRASTDYALEARRLPAQVAEVLAALHEIAIADVIPRLPLPAESLARSGAEETLKSRLDALRRAVPAERTPIDVAAPSVTPSAPGPEVGIR